MTSVIRAVLFDLDGTLLDNDMDRFLPAYFGLLAPHVAPYIPPEEFMPALMAATQAMVRNVDPALTNQQVFVADFFSRVGRTAEEMMPVFGQFYATQFPRLRPQTRRKPEARQVVQAALDAGLDVVIATNPLFPETAIQQRMEWAGVAGLPFRLVTSYEVMCSCKPHVEYYLEIARRIGQEPAACAMVGDDWTNDIIPSMSAGMRAYWLNLDAPLPPGGPGPARGELADLPRWLARAA